MNQVITRKNLLAGFRTRFAALRLSLKKLSKDNRAEGYLDVASAPVNA